MYYLKYSNRFKKDLKKLRHDKATLKALEKILDKMVIGEPLASQYKNHRLKGEFKDCFECHIRPDVLLIYKKTKQDIYILLLRIGSHSDLF